MSPRLEVSLSLFLRRSSPPKNILDHTQPSSSNTKLFNSQYKHIFPIDSIGPKPHIPTLCLLVYYAHERTIEALYWGYGPYKDLGNSTLSNHRFTFWTGEVERDAIRSSDSSLIPL